MRKHCHRKKPDPLLRTQPWKAAAVFFPLEQVIWRLERDGTIDTAGRQVVFKEDSKGGWYDLPAALRGVIEFHEIASMRGAPAVDLSPLKRFAAKLEVAAPIFDDELVAIRACIASCKAQAMHLRVSEADDILKSVRIGEEIDRIKQQAA